MRRRTGMGRLIPPLVIFIVCSMTLRWTHVLVTFSHQNSEAHNLSPFQNAMINTAVANKHKQQSSNNHNINDEHNNLRAAPRTLSELNILNETAPTSTLIYPLHAKSGTHHAYLYIGTPPQRQTLIVDTGSRLTAFPCEPHCPDCGTHASSQYHLQNSSTHEIVDCNNCKLNQVDFPLEDYMASDGIGGNSGDGPSLRGTSKQQQIQQSQRNLFPTSCIYNKCGLDQRYTEGSSWKAFEVQDKIWLGLDDETQSIETHTKFATPFTFGCQVSEHGLFKTQYADGIMGLSMYTQTLVGTWYEQGTISHESFSLCLNSKGGHIAIGGIANQEEDKYLSPMQFTPFSKQQVWYYTVSVTSISVGKHKLPKSILPHVNDHKGTIVDSGTTDTFISWKVAKPFIFAWERITKRQYNNRLQLYTYEQFNELPVITFDLDGGVQWEIHPRAYMEDVETTRQREMVNATEITTPDKWEGNRGFISRIYVDEPHGVVLGSNAMLDKEIYFDLANRRLGVAKAKCAY